MRELYSRHNLIKYFDCILNGQEDASEDIYDVLVGRGDVELSQVDRDKQFRYVDYLSRTQGGFDERFAPHLSYINSNEYFCRMASCGIDDKYLSQIKHRLYFNFGDERMDFVAKFVDECNKQNIPFMLKWSKKYARKDNLVIYCCDDNIQEIAGVLSTIKEDNCHFATPRDLPLSAEDFGWFAYGVEGEENSRLSYNKKVAECIERACKCPYIFNAIRQYANMNNCPLIALATTIIKHSSSVMGNNASYRRNIDGIARLKMDIINNSMALIGEFLNGLEGFVYNKNGDCCVDVRGGGENPIREIVDGVSGAKIEIYPSSVVNAIVEMSKEGKINFEGVGIDTLIDYCGTKTSIEDCLRERIKEELNIAGLTTVAPYVLKEAGIDREKTLR